jgi:hypothetical protein
MGCGQGADVDEDAVKLAVYMCWLAAIRPSAWSWCRKGGVQWVLSVNLRWPM